MDDLYQPMNAAARHRINASHVLSACCLRHPLAGPYTLAARLEVAGGARPSAPSPTAKNRQPTMIATQAYNVCLQRTLELVEFP
jgi:hypothetical protein